MLGDNIEWVEPPPTPPAGDLRDGGLPADVLRALDGESARKVRVDGKHGEWRASDNIFENPRMTLDVLKELEPRFPTQIIKVAPDGLGLAFALPPEMCEPETE